MLDRSHCASLTLTAAGLLSSLSFAAPQSIPAERRRVETTPQGAFVVVEHTRAAPSGGAPELSAPGLAWTRSDGGAGWVPFGVALGDRAGQVFAEYGLNSEAAELLSSFDTNPPTPVFTDPLTANTQGIAVASADAVDTHVAVELKPGNVALLRKYSSSSGTADWTYTFAATTNQLPRVAISRDGQTIAAAIMDDPAGLIDVAIFGPGSNVPLSFTPVVVGSGNTLRGFDLSADGSTLYFSGGLTAYVFDVASAAVTFFTGLPANLDSHGISGDGSVIAFGGFNQMKVFERSGSTYVLWDTQTLGGSCFCAELDVSDDGSTVAYAWTFYDNYLTVTVNAYDVASKQVTMTNTMIGGGSYQCSVSDVSISADGSRFAVGVWGDQAGLVPEMRVFSRSSNAPIGTLDLPGSVFDLDISPDGQRVACGSKAVHANVSGHGGRVDLLDLGGEDFVLRGAPRIGATVAFDTYAAPGKHAFVMQSLAEDPTPHTFPGIGTLYIDRSTLTFLPSVVVGANGIATKSYAIANDPALVGTSLWFQGLSVSPRQLTNDWIKMTILP